MFQRFILFSLAVTLMLSTVACGSPTVSSIPPSTQRTNDTVVQKPIADGVYPVQQVTYDDISGEYTLMLLNTPAGQPPTFSTANLQMARLTDEEIKAGQKSQLRVENQQPSLHLTEDFRIEYVHNVTETQTNPQTGQSEVVVVRQEPSFWTPFAGALAGQALGSLLFRPQYYFPPVYQPGVVLTGYGGYGRTYSQAASNYQSRYNAPPVAVRNQRLRTTGQLRSPSSRPSVSRPSTGSSRTQVNRPTGSGYGSTDLRRSNSPTQVRPKSNRSFGTSRSRTRSRRR